MSAAVRPPVEVRFVDRPANHSFRPGFDAIARAAGHRDFAALLTAQQRLNAAAVTK